MAYWSKREFAELCGDNTSNLSNYIKRGKVVMSGDVIDDSIEPNKSFLEKKRVKKSNEPAIIDRPPVITPPGFSLPGIKPPAGKRITYADLERQKLELSNEKLKKENEKLKIQIEKLNGILIPTELAVAVIIQQSKSFSVALKNYTDNMLADFAAIKKLSSKETADMRAKIISNVNKAIADGIEESKKQVKNIVNLYSETRGKGEKK